jgi:hypothetical protein
VTVDWVDEHGATQSQTYESRDQQFELAVPDSAAAVRVYAANFRTGRDAFGSLDLRPPPPPPPSPPAATRSAGPAPSKPAPPKPAKPAALPPVGATPAPVKPAADMIERRSFDSTADRPRSASATGGP